MRKISLRKLTVLLVTILLVARVANCQEEQPIKPIAQLRTAHETFITETLSEQMQFKKKYLIKLDQEEFKKNVPGGKNERFYLWVNVEPIQGYVYEQIELKIQIRDIKDVMVFQKDCGSKGGIDSCFIINQKYHPDEGDQAYAHVKCEEQCSYKISATINQRKNLTPNTSIQLDFEETAYTQIFSLDPQGIQYDQLRIILKPIKFLNYPAPIEMYANKGWRTPTKDVHDFKSIHIWDDGVGIFLHKLEIESEIGWGKGITISVTGPEKNVLALENYFLKEDDPRKLTPYEPYFDYAASQLTRRKYFFDIVDSQKNGFIRVQAFHGKVQVMEIVNKNTSQSIQHTTLKSEFSEINIKLNSEQIKLTNTKIAQVTLTAKKPATYMIQYYPQTIGSLQLLKNSETRYSQLTYGKADQYIIKILEMYQASKTSVKFSVTTKILNGNFQAKFFYCNLTDNNLCIKNATTIMGANFKGDLQPSLIDSSGIERTYRFELPWEKLNKKANLTEDLRQTTIIIAILNSNAQQILQYFIRYENNDRVYFLKQQQTKKQRVDEDEQKLFKFSIYGNDVEEIQIHTVQISGKVKFEGYLQDPRTADAKTQVAKHLRYRTLYFERDQFKISANDTQKAVSVYVTATGKQFAFFSLTPQVVRGKQRPDDGRKYDNESKNYNELMIERDVTYNFVIQPRGRMVFQGRPTTSFFFYIHTSMPLQVCMTQNLTAPPFKSFNNCQVEQKAIDDRKTTLFMEQKKHGRQIGDGIANFGVENKNDQNVSFSIKIGTSTNQTHTDQNDSSKIACQQGVLGQISQHNIISKQNTYCLRYTITKKQEISIMLDFQKNINDNANISVRINNGAEKYNLERRYDKIEKETIVKDCGNSMGLCNLDIEISNVDPTRVFIITQYTNDDIRLVEGMAYKFKGKTQKSVAKRFSYLIIPPGQKSDIQNGVTITLENKVGYFKFYAKLIQDYLFNDAKQSSFPTQKEIKQNSTNIFSSENPFYYLQERIVLTNQQIKGKCGEGHCILAISVFVDYEMDSSDRDRKFIIEVSQAITYVREGQVVAKYLQKNSNAYYEYYHSQNGTIAININDENRNCVDIYWHQMNKANNTNVTSGLASKDSTKVQRGIFQAPQGRISIMLNAKQSCPYSMEVTSNNQHISSIKRGLFADINLESNQTKFFIYEHEHNEIFKIISLHKIGQILIQVKKYENGNLTKIIDDSKNTVFYDKSGIDMVRIQHNQKQQTNKTLYLIKVTANKLTNGSIFIPTEGVQIPISQDQMVKDQLLENQKQIFRVYIGRIAQFMLNMQYGQIKIEIQDQQGKVAKTLQYSTQKQPIIEKFNITNNAQPQDDIFVGFMFFRRVKISAVKTSSFIFGLISSENATLREIDVKYGVPYYLYLDANQSEQCINGVMDDSDQQFIVASPDYGFNSSKNSSVSINSLTITAFLEGNNVSFGNISSRTETILKLNTTPFKNAIKKFKFCFKSKEWFSLTFIQTSYVNVIDQNQPFLVSKEANLSMYADGINILQLNQCKGRSVLYFSSEFDKIKAYNSNITSQRKKNKIVEFNHFGPVFINAQIQKGTIVWKRKSPWENRGMGYDLFKTSTLRYRKAQNQKIEVFGSALSLVDQSIHNQTINGTNKLIWVKYRAVTAVQKTHLYNAINCQDGLESVVQMQFERYATDKNFNDEIVFTFDKAKLKSKFSKVPYFVVNVIAYASMESISKNNNATGNVTEMYRFYYQEQQVVREFIMNDGELIIDPTPEPEKQDSTLMVWLTYIFIVLVLIVVGVFLYRKYLKRCVKRNRNNLNQLYSGSQVEYREY